MLVRYILLNWSHAATGFGSPTLQPPTLALCRTIIRVFHDESTFYANADQSFFWGDGSKQALKQKSLGQSLMISDFVDEVSGLLQYGEWSPAVWGVVSCSMGSGLLQYGEWSPAVWGVVSCSMGSGLLQYGEWSPAVWGVVSCSMGSGLLQYGEWSPAVWGVVSCSMGRTRHG